MKRNFWLAALVGVALTGCVNEEVAPEAKQKDVLTFSAPVMATQSRANVKGEIKGNQYDTREDFHVYCKSYKGDFSGWTTDTENYFQENGDVAKNEGGGSNYWSTTTVYYWPDVEYKLAFAAYSPAALDVTFETGEGVSMTETGLNIKGFVVKSDANEQYDLMYSSRVVGQSKSSTAVPLLFHHALSSIVFSTEKEDENVEYKITNLTLKGEFVMKADFNQNIEESATENEKKYKGAAKWTYYDDGGGNPVKEDELFDPVFHGVDANDNVITLTEVNVTTVPTQFTQKESAILLIPQSVGDATVNINYTKTSNDVTLQNTLEIPLSEFAQEGGSKITEWEMGKRYVYRIAFGQNKRIYFEPATDDWVQEPTLIYTIQ